MSIPLGWRPLGFMVAGLSAFLLVAGCSESVSFSLVNPAVPTQPQTQVTPPVGGMLPGTVPETATPGSAEGPTGMNPLAQVLALGRLVSSVEITGCVKPGSMPLPDLTNIPLAQAQATLLLDGLKPGVLRWAYSTTVPAGNVISHDPAAGTMVPPGAVVNLLASLGPQLAAVPDVAGRPRPEAETAIRDAGFTVGTVLQSYSQTVPEGGIVSQKPEAGTLVAPGTAVNLLVSQGPEPVAVPNVLGMPETEARAAILAAGLSVGAVVQGSSGTVPAGSIMSQNPAAGLLLKPGQTVDLVVSSGPEPVAIPNVVGRTQSDAQATLTGAGFSVGATTLAWSASVPAGCVISQDPAAGVVMVPGTAVSLVLSQGPQPVAVPNVAGQPQTEAQAAITGAGLTVGTVTQQYSDTVPVGSVVGQDPAAGTLLTPGSAVHLVLATDTLSLCEYYPFAVGNRWVTAGTNGHNGLDAEISEAFVVNGSQCWKITTVDHAANDKTTYSYVAEANGWMYSYQSLDDLFLLPGISPRAQKVGPQSFKPGESFTTTYNGSSLVVTPVRGRLSDFVSNTSACPFGDVQDTVALKLGSFVIVVFGRDLGPLYFNYLTSSGFYSSITIVGGCGADR